MSAVVAEQAASPTTAPGLREGAFGNARALSCRECGHQVELGPHYACPECFGPLEIAYDFPVVTREEIEAGPRNIWRYKALLPVPTDIEQSPNTEPGFTRLLKAHNLGRELGIDNLWVKDDSTNPTNSFKDRVVACALSAAREFGSKVFACPSTGNLANAVAAAGARAGIKTVVFIPADLEKPKQVNSAVYTDSLVAVNGNYDDVNKLASEIAGEEEGWAFVNVNVRPYYAEGSKTLGYEIAEQLGWRLPDQIVIPVASGSQLTKVDKAFQELIKLGPRRGQALQGLRRPGHRLLPGERRLQGRRRRDPPGQARHHRQEPRDRQPRRRHLRARHLPAYRRCGRGHHRRRGPRGHPAAGPQRGHLHRDGRRHHGRRTEEAGGDRAARPHPWRPWSSTPAWGSRPWTPLPTPSVRLRPSTRRTPPSPNRPPGEPPVSVSVRVPTILRTYTGGESEVSASGATLAEVLDDLDANYTGIKARVLDDEGKLRRFVNVYVGNDDVRFLDNLATPTPDGTQISVIPAVAGGC